MAAREWRTEELVAALKSGGPLPELDLLRACMERIEDLRPHLLEMLATPAAPEPILSSSLTDARTAAILHAGHVLLSAREPAALPIFVEIYQDDRRSTLLQWFTPWLHEYGSMAVPPFAGLVQDRSVYWYGRAMAIDVLSKIGRRFPETRENVVSALLDTLPQPAAAERVSADDDEAQVWSWALRALSRLDAREVLPQAKALYRAGVIDAEVSGDREEYVEAFGTSGTEPRPFNLLDTYRYLARVVEQDMAYERRQRQVTESAEYERSAPDEPTVRAVPKVGRNDPCPCGSGRKYKRCHGRPGR